VCPRRFSDPMVHSTQTTQLSCIEITTISKRTQTSCHRSSIGCVPHDFRADATFDTNRARFLQCDYRYLQTNSNELPLEARHIRVSSGASKTISEPMVRLAQTTHLYCTNANTVSKWSKTSFHKTHSLKSSIGYVQNDF
jgi:hypothetical protein